MYFQFLESAGAQVQEQRPFCKQLKTGSPNLVITNPGKYGNKNYSDIQHLNLRLEGFLFRQYMH